MGVEKLKQWANDHIAKADIVPLQNDASLRRYYRFATEPSSILMDASLDSKNTAFLESARLLAVQGLPVPKILKHDLELGFFQVEDFGDGLLFKHTKDNEIKSYLETAIENIIQIQRISPDKISKATYFSTTLAETELNLFEKWFIREYLELELTVEQQKTLSKTFQTLLQHLQNQPQVVMHRDYHTKNLMLLADNEIGLLDFQDLMVGPITYDVVSLLKDCYVTWPEATARSILKYFHERCAWEISLEELEFYFDITGLQRHLKVLGGFSKIYLQRGNYHYLQYFDRILDYIVQVIAKYPEFDEFSRLFTAVILPNLFEV